MAQQTCCAYTADSVFLRKWPTFTTLIDVVEPLIVIFSNQAMIILKWKQVSLFQKDPHDTPNLSVPDVCVWKMFKQIRKESIIVWVKLINYFN